MTVLSKLPPSVSKFITQKNSLVAISAVASLLILRHGKVKKPDVKDIKISSEKLKREEKIKAAVDGVFLRRLWKILKVLVPGFFSKEMWFIVLVALSLLCRTWADVWMIENGTMIESAIIGRDVNLFKVFLSKFVFAMPLISVVNVLLRYGVSELKLCFRTRLSNHLYDKYLKGFTYYQMSNLDNRIANADQLLTQDVDKFCNGVAELYTNLSKPLLDICIYVVKLTKAIGMQAPGGVLLYLMISGALLTRLRKPLGKMTVNEQKLEGEFRYVNSRLITNSEEIAFYQGNTKEKHTINSSFKKLIDHLRGLISFRMSMGFVDNILAKYVATVIGYLVVSRPFLDLNNSSFIHSNQAQLLEDYYQSGRMLVRMAQAMGRVALAGREMTELAGFTSRVSQFSEVLDDLNKGKYERTMIESENGDAPLRPGSGTIVKQDHIIKFEKVPLVTPNGDVLIKEINFEVKSGQNVLVCGPNGCGKSSLFRILGELWPLFGGVLTKPDSKQLFYVPQRPYMTIGKLRDQVIYPHLWPDMRRKGVTDDDLAKILEKVQLSYILDREDGWDAVQDWMDVLSGGEKQRIAMARLFYHKPQFAILDECTSAVSVDVEGFMYQHCREVGITLFTVSHRKSLWQHHEYYLHMDGRGSFEFLPITDKTVEFGS